MKQGKESVAIASLEIHTHKVVPNRLHGREYIGKDSREKTLPPPRSSYNLYQFDYAYRIQGNAHKFLKLLSLSQQTQKEKKKGDKLHVIPDPHIVVFKRSVSSI